MKAYVYGCEVTVMDFYKAKRGTPYCTVRINDTGRIEKVPTLCVEIRK